MRLSDAKQEMSKRRELGDKKETIHHLKIPKPGRWSCRTGPGATTDDRRLICDGKLSQRESLRNHQFAALRFLESHGLVESDDGALRHFVRRRLSGDALQPKAGSGH